MDLPCFLSDYFDFQCGNFRGKSECANILECSDDVSTHLSRCHLSREKLCEYELILLRCGMFDISHDQLQHMKICPTIGIIWENSGVHRVFANTLFIPVQTLPLRGIMS